MAISRGPKLVTNGLVLALDASDDNSFAAQNLPIKNGLLLWLDAADDDSFVYSSGTEVSQWRDKSGNNFHANQATVGQQPSRSAVINSRKSVNFVAANGDYIVISSGIALPNDASIFIVYKPATQSNQYAVLIDNYHGQGGNYGFVIQRVSTNSQFYYANAGDGTGFIDTSASPWTYTDNVIQLLSLNKASSTGTPYISGTAQTSRSVRAATAQSTTGLAIGYWGNGGGRFYNGDMCEILIFNRSLNSTEMKQVHTYLGQKWGISNTDKSIADISGNNNIASFGGAAGSQTVGNMPAYDFYNKGALKFNGTSNFIQYPSLLNLSNIFTINFWIKPTSNTRQTIVSNGYPYLANKGFFFVCPGNSATDIFLSLGNDQKQVQSNTGAITTGVVQMVTAVVNGAGNLMKLYVNGSEVSYAVQQNADISLQYDSGIFVTGKRDTNSADYLYSNLYAMQVYNRALTATEVLQNYNAQKSRFTNTIVQSGLILNLDAGNNYSYAGSGSTWYDVSGNNYNGTLIGSPSYTSNNNGGIIFDSSAKYGTLPTSGLAFGSGQFAIEVWVYSTGVVTNNVIYASQSSNVSGFIALYYVNGLGFALTDFNGSTRITTTHQTAVLQNTWYHVVGIRNASNQYVVYVNGVVSTTNSTSSLTLTASAPQIASNPATTGERFTGTIVSLRLYNRSLSAAEVLENYNAIKGRFAL